MTVAAIDWTEGEVGKIHILLSGGHCRIDWGDGNSTLLFTYTRDWVDAYHVYPAKCKSCGERFEITITSSEDNIIGFRASSGDMMVTDVDLSECQSLEYLSASWLIEKLDVTRNPALKKIDVSGDAAALIDLSKSSELEHLSCTSSNRTSLNLSRCNKLTYLDCRWNSHLKKLAVSNQSMLKEVILDGTELDKKSLKYLKETLIRNGYEEDKYVEQFRIDFEI